MKLIWFEDLVGSLHSPIASAAIDGRLPLSAHSTWEQTIIAPLDAAALIGNGGMRAWLCHRREDTDLTAEAFERLGLPGAAAELRAALRDGGHAATADETRLDVSSTREIYAANEGPLYLAILDFARTHRTELLRGRPRMAKAFAELEQLDDSAPRRVRLLASGSERQQVEDLLAARDYGRALAEVVAGGPRQGHEHLFWEQAHRLASDLGMATLQAQAGWEVAACKHGWLRLELRVVTWFRADWVARWSSRWGARHQGRLYPEQGGWSSKDYSVGETPVVRLTTDEAHFGRVRAGQELRLEDRSFVALASGTVLEVYPPR